MVSDPKKQQEQANQEQANKDRAPRQASSIQSQSPADPLSSGPGNMFANKLPGSAFTKNVPGAAGLVNVALKFFTKVERLEHFIDSKKPKPNPNDNPNDGFVLPPGAGASDENNDEKKESKLAAMIKKSMKLGPD